MACERRRKVRERIWIDWTYFLPKLRILYPKQLANVTEDLPESWNEKMKMYLGLIPPNNTMGILQDLHWAKGLFGYFPTHVLGNLLAVQFYDCLLQDMPDLPEQISYGEFTLLLRWLRENIHVHGAKFTSSELVHQVTGEEINPQPYITYLKMKYQSLYTSEVLGSW